MLLNCHTYYSLCYGTLSIEQLLEEVERKGYDRFVLSDINNTSASIEVSRLCEEKKIKPVLGIDFRNGVKQQYIGIAKNNEGFYELNKHLSAHLHENKKIEDIAPSFTNAYVIYPFKNYKSWPLRENEFIGVSAEELKSFAFISAEKKIDENKLVALQPVTFINKRHYNAHRLLRAIDTNTILSKLPVAEQTSPNEIMPLRSDMYAAFSEYPSLVSNTEKILNSCEVKFEFGKFANKNLKHYTGSDEGDRQLLRNECLEGLKYRYKNGAPEGVVQRMEKELEIIFSMNFASYFLINWNIISYAREKEYYYVGRGSGANSMVAYLLRITDVDPIELDLYFERFINPFRSNPPDFDIDFSWTDRDDMTRYIFDTFGHERAALLATYSTFQRDAVLRDLGKVFGLPPAEIDKLQKVKDENQADSIGKLVLRYAELIQGFPSHLSIHASGILISEKPINYYTATDVPPKGYPTTHFSMLEAEDIGLYKFDILSQRGLGKIKDALTLIKQNKNVDIDIHDIEKFKEDKLVKSLLSVGKCIGCFYIESPGMRMLLAKLQADDFLRLVAASSIIRPGVSKSGMMREYILRFRDKTVREKARQAIPELYDLLQETYGVMVYQEDVIKIAHYFAGLTLAEADFLRRGMSWKFKQRNEFWKVKEKFFSNCREKKYADKTIDDIWTQIESFANFAFSKGHSASYAVESYQALYLKAYFPLEYMVATLNNGGGFYRTSLYIHEARMHGAKIVAPCVNNSPALCNIVNDTIYLGLGMIGELDHTVITRLVEERERGGAFKDLYDLIKRTGIAIEQIRLLIRVGALNFTGKNKKELLWEAHSLINPLVKNKNRMELFDVKPKEFKLPELTSSSVDDAFDEMELLGFSLCSPFTLLKDEIPSQLKASDLRDHIGKTVEIVGFMVHVKTTHTYKGERMCFGTFLDMEGMWIDTVHFPPQIKAYPFSGPGCYRIVGRVTEEFDFMSIEVQQLQRMTMMSREDAEVKPVTITDSITE